MRVRMLVVLLGLLTGTALSQTPGPIHISGQIVDQNTAGGLSGVTWRAEGVAWRIGMDEALTSGTTDANGFFNVKLPRPDGWPHQKHIAVRFSKPGFEQISWALNVNAASNPDCGRLKISMRLG